jgi:hypothetical protein
MLYLKHLPLLCLTLCVFFALDGCRGKTGPAGPPGTPGQGTVDTIATYLGDNTDNCGHCHDNLVSGWLTTRHHSSYDSAAAWPGYAENCNQCHSTGWDVVLNNGGYDENHSPDLRNVQCEACHGPMGPNPAVHSPIAQGALNGNACRPCHTQTHSEWITSTHGQTVDSAGGVQAFIAEWSSSSCNFCHTAEGYLYKWDPNYALNPPNFSFGVANGITCGTCHDNHKILSGLGLRAQSNVVLPYPPGYVIAGWGKGLHCANCHRERRDSTQIMSHINSGNAHFGPHESPQSDMVRGVGSYQIPGYAWTVTNVHNSVPDVCVHCHVSVYTSTPPHPDSTGHSFRPNTANCNCHGVTPDFEHVNALQLHGGKSAVAALMDSLENLILTNPLLEGEIDSVGSPTKGTVRERTAAWAWFFVERDASKGVHNTPYALQILRNSITYYWATSPVGKVRKTLASR